MQLIVAEKPSVARDIARVLGMPTRGSGALTGPKHVVTWALGHLVELDEPAAYNPAWKRWNLAALPMIPEHFRLRPVRSSMAQWRVVQKLLRDRSFAEVVNACDAGREGELIFRLCYELAGSRLTIRRLWVSSMTDSALRAALGAIKPGAHYDALAAAARCRAEADWLVGMNATRAVTTRNRGDGDSVLYSIGRVQTPTLALVTRREAAIRAFVPLDYWEIQGSFARRDDPRSFRARWGSASRTRLATEALATAVISRANAHKDPPTGPRVESVDTRPQRIPPPLLFDLTSLQRTANRRWGMSAQTTLDVAQALYESHKLLTYPRTDSRHLSTDVRGELPEIFDALGGSVAYAPFAKNLRIHPPGPTPRVFNDAKVRDHHAIIPTVRRMEGVRLGRDEARIHDLVVRRFLGVFMPDAEFLVTVAVVVVGKTSPGGSPTVRSDEGASDDLITVLPPPPDRWTARGRVRVAMGWQEVAGMTEMLATEPGDNDADAQELPELTVGCLLTGTYEGVSKQTQAPRRYTDATLLAAMESAGRDLDDDALRAAMRDTGLGTPATRAATIETLLRREYIVREGKNLVPTAQGEGLVAGLPVPSLASPELTGAWEARLARMARGEEAREAFMRDIADYVRAMVEGIKGTPATVTAAVGTAHRTRAATPMGAVVAKQLYRCPRCETGTLVAGRKAWGCARWREGCTLVVPFDVEGRKVTVAQLRDLVTRGVTRAGTWTRAEGDTRGRLRLDAHADPPTVGWEPTEARPRKKRKGLAG